MSESGGPIRSYGIYRVPRGDNRQGVVFYRFYEDDMARQVCRSLIEGVAEQFAQQGPFVVRTGFRPGAEPGQYWVGLNDVSCAVSFEGALRAFTSGGRHLRVIRRTELPLRPDHPEDVANPELRPVIEPARVVKIHAAYQQNGGAVAPEPARQERQAAPEPAAPVEKLGPFERMRRERRSLGDTDLGQRFRRGMRGRRRGDQQADGQQ